ncbi:hypothetical protein HYH02_008156 [Chlamydomonas schloesseri]|uniref:NmrA-like domain-containing protein n=1 Tax=Chlamydomonas schloesseri TaxID=2026947 RepID=A0A835WGH8_9CHLO|nr:hypothetical protein HYH02_008156 [Chlamydomonas schloesseri]|eukprot:KAG2447002.1 hypothetical protein HYH02_008156 [Chlamydomonas schloesseri]
MLSRPHPCQRLSAAKQTRGTGATPTRHPATAARRPRSDRRPVAAIPAAAAFSPHPYNLQASPAVGAPSALASVVASGPTAAAGPCRSRPGALRTRMLTSAAAAAGAGAGNSTSDTSSPNAPSSSSSSSPTFVEVPADGRVVLVGITGATGRSALQGLLAAMGPGRTRHTLLAMTRNPGGASAQGLPAGVTAVAGDLDNPASLEPALRGAAAVYCHALSKDGATADPQELVRARSLAAAARAAGVKLILYNSSGGRGCGYGISQMEQKHQVEDILAAAVPTVALQATLFMEELWKRYTRPGILKGSFTWSSPGDRPIQLVAARDLGLAAGSLLAAGGAQMPSAAAAGTAAGGGGALRLRAIELAGDELSPEQMCAAFSKVQCAPVRHNRAPAWPFWFLARDVWRISRFLTERGYQADVAACRRQFPGMLTFEEFLVRTGWADPSRTFEDGIAFATAAADAGKQPPAAVGGGAAAAGSASAAAAAAAKEQ